MKGYRKILVAVNGSTDTLYKGIELAKDEKCWITVLKVVPPYEGDINLTGIKNIEDALDGGAQGSFSAISEIAKKERALIKTRIEAGDVHRKLVEVAEEEKCDLIIMKAEKGGFFSRLLGGNIVEKVINTAPCPVLIVS